MNKALITICCVVLCNLNLSSQTVTDIDGNVYSTVRIGNQVWMAENLKTSRLNNGTSIELINFDIDWADANHAACCWYDNNKSLYGNPFGMLYNWYAVNTNKLCPTGWRVPSKADWEQLIYYLIRNGYNFDGSKSGNKVAKAIASVKYWRVADDLEIGNVAFEQNKNNKSRFNGFPSGHRSSLDGEFAFIGTEAQWWTSTNVPERNHNAFMFSIIYFDQEISEGEANLTFGVSVRCIKN